MTATSKPPLKFFAAVALVCCVAGVRDASDPRGERRSLIIPASDLPWSEQTPGLPIQISLLWGNRETGPFGELVKLPGGFDSGLHAHTSEYRGVLIAGTWIHIEEDGAGADRELTPGSYVFQPGSGLHIDRCKAGADCILFMYQPERPDILWPRAAQTPPGSKQ
jgi:hypothetical protein